MQDGLQGPRMARHRQPRGVPERRSQRTDRLILRAQQLLRLRGLDGMKANAIAGPQLPDLPLIRECDGGRAHKATETGSVRPKNDRHVAGEVDRSDRVGAVVNVGRMQPGLAAVVARPVRLGADEPYAGATRVVVHLPAGGEEGVNIRLGEEIRGSVRPVQHCYVPAVGVGGPQRRRQ